MRMFDKVLIANRGEIACRIIRTLKRLKVGSVGVYSDADRNSLHVAQADESVPLGAGPAAETYLRQDKMLDAARAAGAAAIHPRSEEHTSELQSHLNIVCRLLL